MLAHRKRIPPNQDRKTLKTNDESDKPCAVSNIATHPQILYTSAVEYPFPPVGIVGAADGKNRRAFFFLLASFGISHFGFLCATA